MIAAQTEDALFRCSPVFLAIYNCDAKTIVLQGGTSSGKTYSTIQRLFMRAVYEHKVVITITSEDIPALKKGAYRDAETIYGNSPFLKHHVKFWNRTDRTITFRSGSIMEFTSSDSIDDAKQGKRDYLFVNEANLLEWQMFWQLWIRTRKQTIIDYNPSIRFWAHEQLIGTEGVQLFISDHRHNPFLTKDEHDKIEGIKDPEFWRVYARGLTGNLKGLIFPNWKKIPDAQFEKMCEENENFFGGLDFGYTNDPTAGVKMIRVGKSLFLKELCYVPGISAIEINQIFTANGFVGSNAIYCEHDPDMVAELLRLDMLAYKARKGIGSILAGITKLKEYDVFYTESSKNINTEREKYMWETDPNTGDPINVPVDKFNHLMDAARYGAYTHFYRDV